LEPIRVLHVFGALNSGGAESRTMDIYRQIDRSLIQFDFLVHTNNKGFFQEEILSMGGRIYCVPRFGLKTILSYPKELKNFFKNHPEYKIIHGHILSTAFIYQRVAKKNNIPIRIAHSRCGSRSELNLTNIIKETCKRLSRYYVTEKFAVSDTAAVSAFGKNDVASGNVKILPNAIKAKRYTYNEEVRVKKRVEFDLVDKFVIGHIGRFSSQKNHRFILDTFKEIHQRLPNSRLMLVGDGELRESIERKIRDLGLNSSVILTGVRSDVPELLQAMDVLIFPSLFEGLPGVVLEAQAAGLPSVISDKITKEVKITDLVKYYSLDESPKKWAELIIEFSKGYRRRNTYHEIVNAGYDIDSVAQWYQNFYLEKFEGLNRDLEVKGILINRR